MHPSSTDPRPSAALRAAAIACLKRALSEERQLAGAAGKASKVSSASPSERTSRVLPAPGPPTTDTT